MVSPDELVDELAESHTVTPQTEGHNPISTTSRDTYEVLQRVPAGLDRDSDDQAAET